MGSNMKTRLVAKINEYTAGALGFTHNLIPLKSITENFSVPHTPIHCISQDNLGFTRGNLSLNFNFNISAVKDPDVAVPDGFEGVQNPVKAMSKIGLLGIPFTVELQEIQTVAADGKENFAFVSTVMEDCVLDSGTPVNYTSGGEPVSAFAGKAGAITLDGITFRGVMQADPTLT